eukprot:533216-Rhodomonas_salina.4
MSIQNVPRVVPMFLRSSTANSRNSYRTRDIQCMVFKDDKSEVLSRKPTQSKADFPVEFAQPAPAEHRGRSTDIQVEKTQKYSCVLVLGLLLSGGTKYMRTWIAEQDGNITSKRLRQCSCMLSNFTLLVLACDLIPTLAHRKSFDNCVLEHYGALAAFVKLIPNQQFG